jgi:hypothetical protein
LILLFVKYKPELVCEELLKEYGKRTPEPPKALELARRASAIKF